MKPGTDWREARRLRVLELYRKGWKQNTIAEALGISKGYVSQLVKRVKNLPDVAQQQAALKLGSKGGRKPTFTTEQRQQIVGLLEKGAASFCLPGEAWTLRTLRLIIHRELGFWVGKSWLAQMLGEAGYSCQKPQTIAKERNDKAVAGFRGGWHNLKKGHSHLLASGQGSEGGSTYLLCG